MTLEGSNRLADLADRIRVATRASAAASLEAARHALDAGRLLNEVREECRHGQWLPFLERAGMAERQAQRLMQLARSGLKPDTVSDLGVKGALALLAKWKLPDDGSVLQVSDGPLAHDGAAAWVWESEEHPGHFHLAGMAAERAFADATRKPVSREAPKFLFRSFAGIFENRFDGLRFYALPPALKEPCKAFRAAVLADHQADELVERACALVEQADARLAALAR